MIDMQGCVLAALAAFFSVCLVLLIGLAVWWVLVLLLENFDE